VRRIGNEPCHTDKKRISNKKELRRRGTPRPLSLPPLLPLLPLLHLCLRPRTASLELLSNLKPEVIITSCLIMKYYVYMQTFYVLTACCLMMIMA
jgi:hypothetical protein